MIGVKENDNFKNRKELTASFLHSLSGFLAAYIFIYFLSGISVLYIAFDLDVPATLFVNTIDFGLSQMAKPLTSDIIVSVFMAQPVSSFIMAIIAVFLFMLLRPKKYWLQLFLLWLFLHGFNFTFGLVSEDLLLKTGLFNVAVVMEIRQVMLILTIGISLFFLVKAGTLVGKLFYARIYQPSSQKNSQLKVFVYHFFLPWITGSLIILLLSFQHNSLKDILLRLSMFVSILPIIFLKEVAQKNPLGTKAPKLFVSIIAILLAFALAIVFAIMLKSGINLGIS